MITRENRIKVDNFNLLTSLKIGGVEDILTNSVFFDLEHYVYKKPICVGVFGCCYFDEASSELKITQYMIENKIDAYDILFLARDYFHNMHSQSKKYIVTFSGNNDFTMINYLFKKYNIDYTFSDYFEHIDIQKVYEKTAGINTGLKTLEKKFDIIRDSDQISGSNLAKTFSKIVKDPDYIARMPQEKVQKILLYNEADVINLFHICFNWDTFADNSQLPSENK